MKLLFATGNAHKIEEAKQILQADINLVSKDVLDNTPPESGETFKENAQIKAQYIFEQTGLPCFAEDSGLCVDALNNAPGIYSARFSGTDATDEKNNRLLLEKLTRVENRKAYFVAVICFYDKNGPHFFEGKVFGTIAKEHSGHSGFGYDPLFIPAGYSKTFAELGKEVKNKISHRKEAMKIFSEFLNTV